MAGHIAKENCTSILEVLQMEMCRYLLLVEIAIENAESLNDTEPEDNTPIPSIAEEKAFNARMAKKIRR